MQTGRRSYKGWEIGTYGTVLISAIPGILRLAHLLHEEVPLARQTLRKLLVEPLTFKPVMADGHKSYAFEGKARAGMLLEPFYLEMASQGDSNPCYRRERAYFMLFRAP